MTISEVAIVVVTSTELRDSRLGFEEVSGTAEEEEVWG